jgi:hypothetical protein
MAFGSAKCAHGQMRAASASALYGKRCGGSEGMKRWAYGKALEARCQFSQPYGRVSRVCLPRVQAAARWPRRSPGGGGRCAAGVLAVLALCF